MPWLRTASWGLSGELPPSFAEFAHMKGAQSVYKVLSGNESYKGQDRGMVGLQEVKRNISL